MKICAIVLDYRGAARTELCMRSLIDQGIRSALIVDNSSNIDASRELALAVHKLQRSSLDYEIKIIRPNENLGFGRGVNFALNDEMARSSDAFLLINNDAIASQQMVSKLCKTLFQTNADLVAPTILDPEGNEQPIMWYQRHFGLITRHSLPFSFPYLSGCCLMFRRSFLQSNKLFDEDFFMYGEDTLLGWQIASSKKVMMRSQSATVLHANRGSSKQYGFFYEYHMARANALLAYKAHVTPLEVPLLLLTKFCGLIIRGLVRSLRARSMLPLLASVIAWFPLKIRVA